MLLHQGASTHISGQPVTRKELMYQNAKNPCIKTAKLLNAQRTLDSHQCNAVFHCGIDGPAQSIAALAFM